MQTVDYFTPIVDDPFDYGQIAAANSLSDVYAMGGRPLTVLNIACFDPSAAPADVWAEVLRGMYEKTLESGAVVMGGHSVEDSEPKFGMAVTGVIEPHRTFANTEAKPGDDIYLTKPLGTGIITTAAKFDACPEDTLSEAVRTMARLNKEAMELGQAAGVRCATDITGFGLAGHLFNVARGSQVRIEIDAMALPLLSGLEAMVTAGLVTGGAARNAGFLGGHLEFEDQVPEWLRQVVLDPQTSGGLALFSRERIPGAAKIGRVVEGPVTVRVSATKPA